MLNNQTFKTTKIINGKQYVELEEVVQLFQNLANTSNFLGNAAKVLGEVQKDLVDSSKVLA